MTDIYRRDVESSAREIVAEAGLLDGAAPSVRILYRGRIDVGTTVGRAHRNWTEAGAAKAQTPPGAPRLPDDHVCGSGLHWIEAEVIEKVSGGMSSYYGFEGRFVSVLFDESSWRAVDVRGEDAH